MEEKVPKSMYRQKQREVGRLNGLVTKLEARVAELEAEVARLRAERGGE